MLFSTVFTEQYCAHLDKVETVLDLDIMEDIAAFVSNPFFPIDIEQIAAKFKQVFALPSGADMEIVDMQNDQAESQIKGQ